MDENRASTEGTSDDPLIGTTVGRYEVHERRGSGGMGTVYRAYDPTLDRSVALTWYEAVDPIGGPWMQAYQVALGTITIPDRAGIAAGVGSTSQARRLYARFLRFYDRAVPVLEPHVERASAALQSLDRS